MTNRGDLTDEQWERLAPLLPPQQPQVGRPAADHRRILNGILWRVRTGAPWRDVPERYGPWPTLASRFRRWRRAGIWDRVVAAVQQQADAAGRLDWDVQFVDGSVIRAHQQALGRSQGGYSTKVHLRAEGGGKPLTIVLTPGQAHEAPVFDQLLDQVAVKRAGRGRPRKRPKRIVADKGYSSRKIRQRCRRRGIHHTIPHKQNEHRTGPFDRPVYRRRNVIERLINRCKHFRGLATRYEKLADTYRTLWVIVITILWL
jgi:transposase